MFHEHPENSHPTRASLRQLFSIAVAVPPLGRAASLLPFTHLKHFINILFQREFHNLGLTVHLSAHFVGRSNNIPRVAEYYDAPSRLNVFWAVGVIKQQSNARATMCQFGRVLDSEPVAAQPTTTRHSYRAYVAELVWGGVEFSTARSRVTGSIGQRWRGSRWVLLPLKPPRQHREIVWGVSDGKPSDGRIGACVVGKTACRRTPKALLKTLPCRGLMSTARGVVVEGVAVNSASVVASRVFVGCDDTR